MTPRAGVVVVRAVGEIDLLTAIAWRRTLRASASIAGSPNPPVPLTASSSGPPGTAGRGPRRVVCDLSAVTFLGATGLGVLVDLTAHAATCGVELCLVTEDRGPVWRLLCLSGLDRCIVIHPHLDQAVSSPISGESALSRAAS
ncbi:STAS domain-containing protein [Actinomycetospora flava]|uniref:STAS domain-containing protein n=1 Tax=Actinomycetospora flava TaxID=3129232 RepID=UPI00359F6247